MFWLCIFYFKHKTANDMRISDWSSDVCSSDLREHELTAAQRDVAGDVRGQHVGRELDPREADVQRDRKSVVEGKSVSVSVDLGGRRIMKQKTMNNNN